MARQQACLDEVAPPRHAEARFETPAQGTFRQSDMSRDDRDGRRVQVLAGPGHGSCQDRVGGSRKAQRLLVIEELGDESAQRDEIRVGDLLGGRPTNGPASRVNHHLSQDGGRRQDPDALARGGHHGWREEDRDRPNRTTDCGAMLDPCGYPGRLLRGQQAMRGCGLDLDCPVKGVLDLVQIMGMPCGDQLLALVEEASGRRPASSTHVHESRLGRQCQIFDRLCRDGHR